MINRKILYSLFYFMFMPFFINAIEIPEMLFIEGKTFFQGSYNIDNTHKIEKTDIPDISYNIHSVTIDSFYISKYEITVKEFYDFINETGYETFAKKQWLSWRDNSKHPKTYNSRYKGQKFENYPITEVTYKDILEYCKWLSEKTGERYRLPTESEWEFVATSGKQNLYPWGNKYKVIYNGKRITDFLDIKYDEDIISVFDTKEDCGDFNICGMFGNVREFCLDSFDPLFYQKAYNKNPLQIEFLYSSEEYVYRGYAGYNMEHPEMNNITKRFSVSNMYYSTSLGFRIVKENSVTVFNEKSDMECVYNYALGTINDNFINLRDTPSLKGRKIGQLMKNDKITIYYRTFKKSIIDNDENYWYFVRKDYSEDDSKPNFSWIFGKYIDFQ